jgi:hypothetical protein
MLPWDSYTSSILNVQATHSPGYGFTSHRVVPYGRPPMLLGESLRPTAVTQDQLTVRGIRDVLVDEALRMSFGPSESSV